MAKEEQIKTSIDLTGEKEYRAACTNINSSLREIGSEMKLTTAEFADNADSVEALTAKQKLLQKQFDEQAKKAEAAEKALKKMRDNGIEPTNPAYQKMQTNLNNTKADMVKIQKEIDDTSKKLKSSKVDWESVGETVGKAGKAIGAACAAMGAAIAAAGAAFFGLAEETREARENMGKLETSFTTAGHSAEDAKNTYTELYGVLGDDGQATEAAAHLAKLTTNEKELSDWTNICTGVYATFGDSLPIEGLTEAANETAKTGSITGNLADALNWAGVSEDDFQASLDACTSEQERQALITSTLNGLYSEAADKYREVNGDIIDAQKATANLNSAMAALGAIAEPIITKLKQLAAELLQEITPFVELIGKGLTGALSGAESAAEVNRRLGVPAVEQKPEQKPQGDAKNLYRVQLGAFEKKDNATAFAAKLKKEGFDTYIVQIGKYYKVQVGAFSVKKNAEAMLEKLKKAGHDDAFITYSGTSGGTSARKITTGSKVRVKAGAKTYSGGSLASFVYSRDHIVKELSGKRAVITYGGTVVAAVNVDDLTLV